VTVVRIPPTLRAETGGERQVEAEGSTVRDVLEDLTQRFPALRDRLWENGDVAPFVNVYVGGEDVRTRDGIDTPVSAGQTVILLPAMAGGCSHSWSASASAEQSSASPTPDAVGGRETALAPLGRTHTYCPARRSLVSFASDAPGTR
jgi:molybdopterin synthase sulfur carrier subunit